MKVTSLMNNSMCLSSVILRIPSKPWSSHNEVSHIANEYVYLALFSYFLISMQRFRAPTKIRLIWKITGALWLPSTIFFTLLPWETLRPCVINTLVMNNSTCLASLILRCEHEGRDLVTVGKVIKELNNSEWLALDMVSPERKSRKAFYCHRNHMANGLIYLSLFSYCHISTKGHRIRIHIKATGKMNMST
jgi:hypothetical protein